MKKLEIYISDDGKRFDTEEECLKYEQEKSIKDLESKYCFNREEWEHNWVLDTDALLENIAYCLTEIKKNKADNSLETSIILDHVITWLFTWSNQDKRKEYCISTGKINKEEAKKIIKEKEDDYRDNHWTEHWP